MCWKATGFGPGLKWTLFSAVAKHTRGLCSLLTRLGNFKLLMIKEHQGTTWRYMLVASYLMKNHVKITTTSPRREWLLTLCFCACSLSEFYCLRVNGFFSLQCQLFVWFPLCMGKHWKWLSMHFHPKVILNKKRDTVKIIPSIDICTSNLVCD